MRLFARSREKNPYGFSHSFGFLVFSPTKILAVLNFVVLSAEPLGDSTTINLVLFRYLKFSVTLEGWAASKDRLRFDTRRFPGYRDRLLFFRKHLTRLKTRKNKEAKK